MLSGRLPARRGATVILGCFVLFGASTIAEGIVRGTGHADAAMPISIVVPQAMYPPTQPKAVPYDPYAGASVPSPQGADILR